MIFQDVGAEERYEGNLIAVKYPYSANSKDHHEVPAGEGQFIESFGDEF